MLTGPGWFGEWSKTMTTAIITPANAAVSAAAARIIECGVTESCIKKTIIRQACKRYDVTLDQFIEAAMTAAKNIRAQLT